MIFNLIGFVSIGILLTPLMLYIYQNMFSNHSITYDKSYVVENSSRKASATKSRKRSSTSASATKNTAYAERQAVNQQFTTRNISDPYDLYK